MAKRARGSVRPGQRRPAQRRPAAPARPAQPAPAAASRPTGLTEDETRRAAELEAQLLAEERAAESARKRSRETAASAREYVTAGGFSEKEQEAYAYVARDVRDILRVGALLLVVLVGLWVLIDVAKVVPIG